MRYMPYLQRTCYFLVSITCLCQTAHPGEGKSLKALFPIQTRESRAISALVSSLSDPSPEIQRLAVLALPAISGFKAEELTQLLDENAPIACRNACAVLFDNGGELPVDVSDRLVALLRSKNDVLRWSAAKVLRSESRSKVLVAIIQAIERENNVYVSIEHVNTLSSLLRKRFDSKGLDALIELLKEPFRASTAGGSGEGAVDPELFGWRKNDPIDELYPRNTSAAIVQIGVKALPQLQNVLSNKQSIKSQKFG